MEREDISGTKVVLLDIEGTTTPIDFVHKTLFSYASENIEAFMERNYGKPEVSDSLKELHQLFDSDKGEKKPEEWVLSLDKRDVPPASEYCRWLIAHDSKAGPMKALQGLVWEEGYRSGKLNGEVYPDVPNAMERWKDQGKRICIYSSGSTLAQRLIYGSTRFGDLTRFISNFYDTAVGNKREDRSYSNIAEREGIGPEYFLFLSDVPEELDAAERAGMKTILVMRESEERRNPGDHSFIRDFTDLFP